MFDPFLLLTPLLVLAVLALVRFIGCDKLFEIDELPSRPIRRRRPRIEGAGRQPSGDLDVGPVARSDRVPGQIQI